MLEIVLEVGMPGLDQRHAALSRQRPASEVRRERRLHVHQIEGERAGRGRQTPRRHEPVLGIERHFPPGDAHDPGLRVVPTVSRRDERRLDAERCELATEDAD